MKISLCLATFNEINFIHYPMDSAYDFVDEVIVVDGGSEDGTVEKVKSYGDKVKVISTDNPPMFHINKQKAIEAATGDWIIQLDADEALTPELREEIKQILETGNSKLEETTEQHTPNPSQEGNSDALTKNQELNSKNPVAYWFPRKNWFLARFLEKGGIYPDYTIRLYKKGTAHFPCKSVHENVEINGAVGYLKNPLLHYADPDFTRYLARWNRYTNLDAAIMLENNTPICFPCYFIGKPIYTFILIYFRHRGFMDGFPGFVWALFSAIRYWVIYIKVWTGRRDKREEIREKR